MKSKIFIVIGFNLFVTTCLGQRPSYEKPERHFSTEIIKVDSILSAYCSSDLEAASKTLQQNIGNDKDKIRFKINKDMRHWKEGTICPAILKKDPQNKTNE